VCLGSSAVHFVNLPHSSCNRWRPLVDMLLARTQKRKLKSRHTQRIHMFSHVLIKQCIQLQPSQPRIFDLVCQTKLRHLVPTLLQSRSLSLLFLSCHFIVCLSLCICHQEIYSICHTYIRIYIYTHIYT